MDLEPVKVQRRCVWLRLYHRKWKKERRPSRCKIEISGSCDATIFVSWSDNVSVDT